jgi:large subunit ribosomal protein L21e
MQVIDMVVKSYGRMHKTRHKLQVREQMTVNKILQKFNVGDSVCIKICHSIHNFPHPKFQGRTGKIIAKRGDSFIVRVTDLSAKKQVIVSPVHMRKQK